jgi:hypothetical protein
MPTVLRVQPAPATTSAGLYADTAFAGPARRLAARHGAGDSDRLAHLDRTAHPELGRLDDLLSADADVLRPRHRRELPRHDHTVWSRERALQVDGHEPEPADHFRQLLGDGADEIFAPELKADDGHTIRIGEMARRLNRTRSTLRQWIAKGIIPPPQRHAGGLEGQRFWTAEQADKITAIADECGIVRDLRAPLQLFATRVATEISWAPPPGADQVPLGTPAVRDARGRWLAPR